jgi:hypothetical protein
MRSLALIKSIRIQLVFADAPNLEVICARPGDMNDRFRHAQITAGIFHDTHNEGDLDD